MDEWELARGLKLVHRQEVEGGDRRAGVEGSVSVSKIIRIMFCNSFRRSLCRSLSTG